MHSVTLISATFDAIVKKYGKVRVRCYDMAHPESYIGFKDCDVMPKDIAVTCAPAYLAAVDTEFSTQLCMPGMRLFAPGDNTQESHDHIAEFLRVRGWAVLVLNGARKEIIKPDGKVLSIADYVEWENGTPEEIGKTITSIYHDSGLAAFPFAITGQICLGRGLTFQNDRFLFDWAIVPNMADRASAYQCAARVLGNLKHLPNYKQCKIITTSRMQRLIEQAENIAINIGRGTKGDHAVVDKDALKRAQVGPDGRAPVSEDDFVSEWKTFDSFAAAKTWGVNIRIKKMDANGFVMSSTTGAARKLLIRDVEQLRAGKKTACMPTDHKKKGDKRDRLFVPYTDKNDNTSCKWIVHRLTRITEVV